MHVTLQDYTATLDGMSVVPPVNTTNNGTALFTFKEASLILPLAHLRAMPTPPGQLTDLRSVVMLSPQGSKSPALAESSIATTAPFSSMWRNIDNGSSEVC